MSCQPPAVMQIDPRDNVAVALRDLAAGEIVDGGAGPVPVGEPVARGHKLAIAAITVGGAVTKYGWPIGTARRDIAAGERVHDHNLATALEGVGCYDYRPLPPAPARAEPAPGFLGYRRGDGRVATRNEIWVLPTVGCVARTASRIAAIAHARHAGAVDGVFAFAHPFGCSQLGDDLAGTRALLASLACNPNAGGVLFVGLGCEENQLDALLAEIPEAQRAKVRIVEAQAAVDEVEAGVAQIDALVAVARLAVREPVPFGELAIGLKCGGSDGLSGLTANPLVGRIADRVVATGGSAVLTEIPEIFGAEQLLMARARDRSVFDAIVALVNDFKRYFIAHDQPVSENPSPGNIAGGITTLEEKSLGAVQKAGRSPVADVRRYAERLRRRGLTLLDAPGNDAVSSTALAAAGATLILFTTGRGTPLGFPVPTVKIASNSRLAAAKPGWIDFDAGRVLDQGFDVAEAALVARLVAIASGEPTAAERSGDRDIAIWKRGVTL